MKKYIITVVLGWALKYAEKVIQDFLDGLKGKPVKGKPVKGEPAKPAPKPEPVPEVPKEPKKPEPPKKDPVEDPLPEFDSHNFEHNLDKPLRVDLLQLNNQPTQVRHRNGTLYLVNATIGDELYIDAWRMQTVGQARIHLHLNKPGTRYLHVLRNGVTIAGLNVKLI